MNNDSRALLLTLAATLYSLCSQAADSPSSATSIVLPESVKQAERDPELRELYQKHCLFCHENITGRVPHRVRFLSMTPHTIYRAMTVGSMRVHAQTLSDEQKRKLSVLLSYQEFEDTTDPSKPNLCTDKPARLDLKAPQWNGWGNSLENYRYQPSPGLTAADVPRLKLKWAFAYPKWAGKANGQPTVIGERVYVSSEAGIVYALNAKTGCTYWTHVTESGVRTAIVVGPMSRSKAKNAVYFGDGSGHMYAVNAETGQRLWKARVEIHLMSRITAAPLLHKGILYVPVSSLEELAAIEQFYPCCTFRGSVVAMEAATGKVLWRGYVLPENKPFKANGIGLAIFGPAGGAIWSTPTMDVKRRTLYVGTGNSYTDAPAEGTDAIVAINMDNGAVRWNQQFQADDTYLLGCAPWESGGANCPSKFGGDLDFGASPILQTLSNGKQLVIVGGKNGRVAALNPDTGRIVWDRQVSQASVLGGIQFGMASDGKYVFAAAADYVYPEGNKPGITALALDSGAVAWHTPAPQVRCTMGEIDGGGSRAGCALGQSAAVTAIPGAVFSGALNARLRAYDSSTGKIIWEYVANGEYQTVNGVVARGGSFDGGGPTLVNGMMYVNSGYGSTLESGNVLLAFSVDGN